MIESILGSLVAFQLVRDVLFSHKHFLYFLIVCVFARRVPPSRTSQSAPKYMFITPSRTSTFSIESI
jgi:hypothetical protein